MNIAKYFGLPGNKIFLTNSSREILLSSQSVLDELFPMQTSKLKGENPIIYVTFVKNMSTLDYILGDPNQKNTEKREAFQKSKDEKDRLEKANRKRQNDEKAAEMSKQVAMTTEEEKLR